jgi:hypothetical protein
MAGPLYLALLTYLIMLLAVYWHRVRRFHVPVMLSVIVFDLGMPFYLFLSRDWYKRLIVNNDIMSFGVWMHFGLLISLFVLYAIQVNAGWRLLKDPDADTSENSRREHRNLARGILLVRALVIISGALLAEPDTAA